MRDRDGNFVARMRRGHRLHSIEGLDELEPVRFNRSETALAARESQFEREFLEAIRNEKFDFLNCLSKDINSCEQLAKNWELVQKSAKEVAHTDSQEIVSIVLEVLTHDGNSSPLRICELFMLEALELSSSSLVIAVLDFWASNKGQNGSSEFIDRIPNFRSNSSDMLTLVERTIYCATVDKQDEILQDVLLWHEDHCGMTGPFLKLNADCMIHAALEDDKERLKILFSYGYRLGPDTDKRISKDYLKRIKLFRARATPVYNIVAFEASHDIQRDDPLKKAFEYARMARRYASKIQDFTKEYMDIAGKCEDFAKGLLDRCTTKHEVQTLLQTRSFLGHTDANFNIAILDGHKEFVAHEKFQQLLHKKWGQRDRLQWKNTPSYNIFWSEMDELSKTLHIIKQVLVFCILPLVVLASSINGRFFDGCSTCDWFIRQSQIPVNRFLYWEMSKYIFYGIVLLTLVDGQDIQWYDLISVFWIISYLLENLRTIHRLYRYGGNTSSTRIFKRWLTFRNVYVLSTDIIFLIALILRCAAYYNHQCRRGCPYEGNEIAYIAAAIWSFASLLTFLRSIQVGLMWRQTGPIIISMSYMIFDVMIFLFIFVIVYISFTLSTVYVYDIYNNDQTEHFNSHKSAFKLFFWALIRTGNPQFADIRIANTSSFLFNSTCLKRISDQGSLFATRTEVEDCLVSSHHTNEIDEGVSYITGNLLWALYQFTVFIVLLSILRARMVNTYHRIFKEADIQWKFFRASIWWKYLDEDSILPPPYTLFYFCHQCSCYVFKVFANTCQRIKRGRATKHECSNDVTYDLEDNRKEQKKRAQEEMFESDKAEFISRYRKLMLMLVNAPSIDRPLPSIKYSTLKLGAVASQGPSIPAAGAVDAS